MTIAPMRFFDPLYGPVILDELERKLVLTSEFQRLRCVRMCNINSMLISGASEISRFEHSVGVLRLAQMWGDANSVVGDDSIVLRAAALLHDMQTGPFGHSLQYVVEDNCIGNAFVHDDILHGYHEQFHQRLLATAGYQGSVFSSPQILKRLWKRVAEAIKGEGQFGPLISGSLDLDNLDNVVRLAYHVGVASTADVHQIPGFVRQLKVEESDLCISDDAIGYLERWQEIRQILYRLLLLDWAEFSAKAMLTHAIELAFENDLLDQQSWLLTDEELLLTLEHRGTGELQSIGELVRRIRLGQLYQPVFLSSSLDIEIYDKLGNTGEKRELEKSLASIVKATGKSPGKLLVHLILDHRKTCRSVRVRIGGSKNCTTVGIDSKQLLIGIFSSVVLSASVKKMIEKEFRKLISRLSAAELRPIEDPVKSDHETAKRHAQQANLEWDK